MRKVYSTAYTPHMMGERMTGAALIAAAPKPRGDGSSFRAKSATAELLADSGEEDERGADGEEDSLALHLPGGGSGGGVYSHSDARTVIALLELPSSLEDAALRWLGERVHARPPAESLDSALTRWETGESESLEPPPGQHAPPLEPPCVPVDELAELLLRCHLAVRAAALEQLRFLFQEFDINGDGVLTVDEFSRLVRRAAKSASATGSRSVSDDECEALFLEALRETLLVAPSGGGGGGGGEDAIVPLAWERVGMRHGLAGGVGRSGLLELAPPLALSQTSAPLEEAYTVEERRRAARAKKRGGGGGAAGGAAGADPSAPGPGDAAAGAPGEAEGVRTSLNAVIDVSRLSTTLHQVMADASPAADGGGGGGGAAAAKPPATPTKRGLSNQNLRRSSSGNESAGAGGGGPSPSTPSPTAAKQQGLARAQSQARGELGAGRGR